MDMEILLTLVHRMIENGNLELFISVKHRQSAVFFLRVLYAPSSFAKGPWNQNVVDELKALTNYVNPYYKFTPANRENGLADNFIL